MSNNSFFFNDAFNPHGNCFLWNPDILWLHVISDALISAAFAALTITLCVYAYRQSNINHRWVLLVFTMFTFSVGINHMLSIVVVWTPYYGIQGLAKAIGAAIAVSTSALFIRLVPKLLANLSSGTENQAYGKD